jgi:formylglycine-generating enzyme required for sulfatase activity
MSDFYRRFLSEDVRKMGAPSGRQIFLAAFGKHPGWDDHVEDLGLESESLVYVKTRLYVQGIGGQIDSGAWEKLDEAQRLPAFKHVLLWQRGNQVIIGRMWASSDGKGRTRYPLIVCAHCAGMPLEWALEQVLPRLEKIEQACASTNAATEVRALLERHRGELRAAANAPGTSAALPITSAVLGEFINHSSLGPEKEGWFRILHQMKSQMALFAPGRFSLKADLEGLRSQQVRVPACGPSAAYTLLLWSKFFQTQVDSGVPLLYTLPLEGSWVDVTAGELTPAEAFALRASPKAIPLASEVPYNLEPAFRDKARSQLAGFAGDTAMKARPAPGKEDGPVPASPSGGKMKLLRWLGGGAAVLAVAGLAVALTFGNRGTQKQAAAGPSSTNALSDARTAAEAQARLEQQEAAAEAQRLAQSRAKAEAEAKAKAEEVRLAALQAEQRRQAEAQAKAKADAEARERMIAAETEKQRLAQEAKVREETETRAKAELEAKARAEAEAKAKAEQLKTVAPVLASVAPASIPEVKAAPGAPTRQITNSVGLELILLPGDVWAGKFEVTQGEFSKVMGRNPSKVTGNARLPVESVTWEDAKKFCDKLSELEKAAGSLPAGFAYDLPTQAQWETLLANATFAQAVTSQQSARSAPEPVGSQSANNHGLYDVLGNVWEWCVDGPSSQEKALRGGAFNNQKTFRFKPLTPATVHKLAPNEKSHDVGFRCVMAKTQ